MLFQNKPSTSTVLTPLQPEDKVLLVQNEPSTSAVLTTLQPDDKVLLVQKKSSTSAVLTPHQPEDKVLLVQKKSSTSAVLTPHQPDDKELCISSKPSTLMLLRVNHEQKVKTTTPIDRVLQKHAVCTNMNIPSTSKQIEPISVKPILNRRHCSNNLLVPKLKPSIFIIPEDEAKDLFLYGSAVASNKPEFRNNSTIFQKRKFDVDRDVRIEDEDGSLRLRNSSWLVATLQTMIACTTPIILKNTVGPGVMFHVSLDVLIFLAPVKYLTDSKLFKKYAKRKIRVRLDMIKNLIY